MLCLTPHCIVIFVTTVGMDILAHKIVHELWIGGDGARNYSSTMQKKYCVTGLYHILRNYWVTGVQLLRSYVITKKCSVTTQRIKKISY
jgi:hypothetical protein